MVAYLSAAIQTEAFETAKELLFRHAMLAYPDFKKPFNLYTDASNLQLGATLEQDG